MSTSQTMDSRVCVVTGATAGIGREIARGLARLGARVVILSRTEDRGRAARDEIARSTGNDRVESVEIDLARLGSVRAAAAELRRRYPAIHVLVNNAGGWHPRRQQSPDGIELTWAVNVLGPCLLTALLIDELRAGRPARIVNVASEAAGGMRLDDVEFRHRRYGGFSAYRQSKQANRMWTWALAERLEKDGVTANAMHPGFVKSEFNREVFWAMRPLVGVAERIFARTPERGADTGVWLASDPALEGVTGKYWTDRHELRCRFRDPERVRALWDLCERMTRGTDSRVAAAAAQAASS